MLSRLTMKQHATINELQRMKLKALMLIGVDRRDQPVLYVHDKRRRFPMVIHSDGTGGYPELPVRELSGAEIAGLSGDDQDRLLCMDEIGPQSTALRELWDRPPDPPERNTDTHWPE